ncbi:septal ring lytic transglycosylase RlpA family protein [Thalassotalea profundi]|uniref:Endolytic peptidoglycan transglycosylase RlpA n=1 Tax=Thalassotalea profundi TaxID=2036687 RepID=A0ABQ3IGA7_9GAMM|nr:septal ring lytic transglycosylase RlpA family protein [Thalassotalea profundi]GHE80096.1 endolytic peptidoglycan transglycosylase RlpA [Thalassotalea profundi]
MILKITLLLLIITFISSCSQQYGRYQQKHDSHPTRIPTENELKDPIPRVEPKSRGGNKNYTVRGKRYSVLGSATNFVEKGIASWYGNKFHGHLTSNGEIYNMYAMSAAHKNLPLPSYVQVTNLSNNKSVIVRVNDRGPFHENRVIDLSYSAAYKLDMLNTGTANVLIEALPKAQSKEPSLAGKNITIKDHIQVFATEDKNVALKTASTLSLLYQYPAFYNENNGIYRVRIGPINNTDDLNSLLNSLRANGYQGAFKVTL